MEKSEPLAAVKAALTAWTDADEELTKLDRLARSGAAPGAAANAMGELKSKLAEARAKRERLYRAALSEMQAHHDRHAR
jgi:hypothetical protein